MVETADALINREGEFGGTTLAVESGLSQTEEQALLNQAYGLGFK